MAADGNAVCEVAVERDGGRLLVRVNGELDLATCAPLMALADEVGPDVEELAIDLAGVSFLDSSGLRALLRLHQAVPGTRVVSPSAPARRVLEVTGLDEVLGVSRPS